jgi:hypothetical protein
MNLPAADGGHDLIPDLLETESHLDLLGIIGSHLDGARIAEEVGCVKKEDVQGVALDPFPAVDETTQVSQRTFKIDPHCRLEGVTGAGLIGDRAYPADAGSDIRSLREPSAPEKSLEEARRFEDFELQVNHLVALDLEVHGSLAFHPGEIVDDNLSISAHTPPMPHGTPANRR